MGGGKAVLLHLPAGSRGGYSARSTLILRSARKLDAYRMCDVARKCPEGGAPYTERPPVCNSDGAQPNFSAPGIRGYNAAEWVLCIKS